MINKAMQTYLTCTRFMNQNPRHGETAPLLGESTPPQGVNGLILPYSYLLYLRERVVSHVQFVQTDQDILHHVDKPFIDLNFLGLVRLLSEVFSLGVAFLAIVMARGRTSLRVLPLLPRSMMRLGRFRVRLTYL
jgi:hypothetical protein